MKKTLLILSITLFSTISNASELKTNDEKVSYVFGLRIGANLALVSPEVTSLDQALLIKGIKDALAKKPELNDEESAKIMQGFAKKEQEYYKAKKEKDIKLNETIGQELLEKNKKKEGVKVTDSGLQYKVIRPAEGKQPKKTDSVKVHYKGMLPDGTEFDSSYGRDEPVVFGLNSVILGWTEGLQLMSVGSKYEFVIPSKLAYGNNAPGNIGPNQVLTFEVELLDVL